MSIKARLQEQERRKRLGLPETDPPPVIVGDGHTESIRLAEVLKQADDALGS